MSFMTWSLVLRHMKTHNSCTCCMHWHSSSAVLSLTLGQSFVASLASCYLFFGKGRLITQKYSSIVLQSCQFRLTRLSLIKITPRRRYHVNFFRFQWYLYLPNVLIIDNRLIRNGKRPIQWIERENPALGEASPEFISPLR
jgi:hypothetical protein